MSVPSPVIICGTINQDITIYNWEEKQSCEPALRDIPLRDLGAHVDTGTYTLKAKTLNIIIRLSDADKTVIQDIFDANSKVNIVIYDNNEILNKWTYTLWFRSKPLVYEYNELTDTNIREWKADLEFIVESVVYIEDGIPNNSIVSIDTVKDRIIDAYTTISNIIVQPEYINDDIELLNKDVWSKDVLKLTYVMRLTGLEKNAFDLLINSHDYEENFEDLIYNISDATIWYEVGEVKWNGDENDAYPWLYTLTLIVYTPD